MADEKTKQIPLVVGASYRCRNKVVKLLKMDGAVALLYEYRTGQSFTARSTELDYVAKVDSVFRETV